MLRDSIARNLVSAILKRVSPGFLMSGSREARFAREGIKLFDVRPPRLELAVGALSGGNQQKVVLAKEMLAEPRLLLLDEPFNGVDAVSEQALLDAVAALKERRAAVVLATHDLALAHLACEEVCLLNRRQYGFGPADGTLTPDRLRAAYGGHALELRGDRVIIAHS